MPITPQQARAELARRELVRRGVPLEQSTPEQPQQDKPFWSGFNAEITPQMQQEHPYLSAIAKTGQDVATIPAHYINQLALNLPRAVAHKFGLQYPETTNPVANVAAKGAGVTGAIMSPVGKAIQGLGKLPAGARLASKMLQGAKIGALGGAAYTPTEDIIGIPQRMEQAVTGGVTGGLLTGASEGIQEGVKAFRKAKFPAKLKPTERVSLLEKEARLKYGKTTEEARLAQQKLNWNKQDTRQIINERIRQSNLSMKQSIAQIDDDIQKSAEKGSVTFQEKLPEFFKSNSKAYGDRLDEVSDALINRKGSSITKGELSNIITDTVSEMQQTGITQGESLSYLNNLYSKYAVKQSIDELGNIITDANNPVNFRQAVTDIRSVWKTVSNQGRYGKLTDTDLAASLLKKNWGNWVSNFAPELQELNTSYRPVIQAMKESARIFKPSQGELATKTAENFLSRLGKSKLSGGEKKLLNMIEQGTEFAPGIGKISQGIEQLGIKRVSTIAKQELNRASLQQGLSDRLGKFEKQGRETAEVINKNKQLLQNRLQSLGSRKEDIMKLMANRDRGRAIRKTLLIGAGVAGGLTSIPYSIQRLLHRVRTNE